MTAKRLIELIDRPLGVVAGTMFFISLALPWRLNAKTGSRTGFDLLPLPWNDTEFKRLNLRLPLRPANDGRWLWFLIVTVLMLTIALFVRNRLIATIAGAAALGFLFLVRKVIDAYNVREFGEDSLGRMFETQTFSFAGVGFYVALGAVVLNVCLALGGAFVHFLVIRTSRTA
jgi:hypothetical protein